MAGLDELSKKPPAFLAGVFLGAAAVLGVAYWQVFWTAEDEARTAAKQQNGQLQAKNAELKKQKEKWEELTLQKDRIDALLEGNQVSLPPEAELPAFFGHMQKQMAASGVQLVKWTRSTETPVDSYVKVPVKITIKGTFYELNNYFYLLYQTDRIITVEDLKLGTPKSEGDEIELTADFVASTFRQKDGAAAANRKNTKAQGKGAKAVKAANARSADAIEKATGQNAKTKAGGSKSGANRLKGK